MYTPLDTRGSVVLRYRTGDYLAGGINWSPCPLCGRTVPRIEGDISRASSQQELRIDKIKGALVNFDTLQHVLDDTAEIEEWQVELRKRHDDPLDVDELILHLALADGVALEQVELKIRTRFRDELEVTPNRIELHPLPEMLQRIKLETALKEVRIVDARPRP